MRKSTIAILVVSILLIVLGFVLVGCGLASSYDSVEYRMGRTVFFQSSFTNYSLESRLLTTFGQMTFVLGIAGVFLFAWMAVKNPGVKKVKAHHEKVESSKPRFEEKVSSAEDAKVEETEEKEE